ncbi:MAG: hypothetical protein FJW23_03780 [Acidimicrobiia bacterium]|nr:hypothetical protein [Acidimicrobiia bacterium]
MAYRRCVRMLAALVIAAGAPLFLSAQDSKLNKQEQQDVNTLVKLVDGIQGGAAAPAQIPVTWLQHHFLKAQDGKTFTAFTLKVDPAALAAPGVALYVRAVPKDMVMPEDKKEAVEYPWDDIQFPEIGPDGRVARALAVNAGQYDVYIGVKEKSTGKRGEVNKTTVFKQELSVPELSATGTLKTSSVILAAGIEQSPMLTPAQQRAQPYTFGGMKVTPSIEGSFSKAGELNLIFWIYGVAPGAGQKPDVEVEYNFHQKLADGEKYFNRTAPQPLNAQTLPPEFDLSVGHLAMGSLSVPLASFPEGEYRLEIKITDKAAGGASITENVAFTVTA